MSIIFKTQVGSHAYGTNIPSSDLDYKGVYCQSQNELYGFKYQPQFEVSKDEVYFEIKRFLELAATANPTMLELLFSPSECILKLDRAFKRIIDNRDIFITKKCRHSFGGYAVAQIKKARGLNKKMNWEKDRVTLKDISDFCYVYINRKTYPLKEWLMESQMKEELCGMVGLNHMPNTYELYYDWAKHGGAVPDWPPYKGIFSSCRNNVICSSVPVVATPECIIHFNKDDFSKHKKEFSEYQEWIKNRNTARYVDTDIHGQQIDGKNLMHTRRLLDMALEIPVLKTILVRRPNCEDLLKIRKGQTNLEAEILKAEADLELLDSLYESSDLPEDVDQEAMENLLLLVRRELYNSNGQS